MDTEPETNKPKLQGAIKSPLSGDIDHPEPPNLTSIGSGPVPEVRGGVWEGGGKKRTPKVLEKWPLALKASPGGLGKSRPNKRLQKTTLGKKGRKSEVKGSRKLSMWEKWIMMEKEGSEDPPRPPGRRENV